MSSQPTVMYYLVIIDHGHPAAGGYVLIAWTYCLIEKPVILKAPLIRSGSKNPGTEGMYDRIITVLQRLLSVEKFVR